MNKRILTILSLIILSSCSNKEIKKACDYKLPTGAKLVYNKNCNKYAIETFTKDYKAVPDSIYTYNYFNTSSYYNVDTTVTYYFGNYSLGGFSLEGDTTISASLGFELSFSDSCEAKLAYKNYDESITAKAMHMMEYYKNKREKDSIEKQCHIYE